MKIDVGELEEIAADGLRLVKSLDAPARRAIAGAFRGRRHRCLRSRRCTGWCCGADGRSCGGMRKGSRRIGRGGIRGICWAGGRSICRSIFRRRRRRCIGGWLGSWRGWRSGGEQVECAGAKGAAKSTVATLAYTLRAAGRAGALYLDRFGYGARRGLIWRTSSRRLWRIRGWLLFIEDRWGGGRCGAGTIVLRNGVTVEAFGTEDSGSGDTGGGTTGRRSSLRRFAERRAYRVGGAAAACADVVSRDADEGGDAADERGEPGNGGTREGAWRWSWTVRRAG